MQNYNTKKYERVIYIVPLILVLINYSNIFFMINRGYTSGHSLTNQIFLGSAYIVAFLLCIINLNELLSTLIRNWIFLLLGLYILSSLFWSSFPTAVAINAGHHFGIIFVIICSVLYSRSKFNTIIIIFVVWGAVAIISSIVISIFVPQIGVMDGRWRGILGHPNRLGYVGFITIWSSLTAMFFLKKNSHKAFYIVLIFLSFFSVFKANSMTGMVCSVFIFCSLIFLINGNNHNFAQNVLKVFFLLLFLSVFLLFIDAFFPEKLNIESGFNTLGRSSTLTGRTTLWEAANIAFHKKSILGWGFDSGRSILSRKIITYGQFHNGYIDVAVTGGIIGIIFLSIILLQLFLRLFVLKNRDYKKSVVFFCLYFAILLHNITESSFLRSPAIIWFMYTLSYFIVGDSAVHMQKAPGKDVSNTTKEMQPQ